MEILAARGVQIRSEPFEPYPLPGSGWKLIGLRNFGGKILDPAAREGAEVSILEYDIAFGMNCGGGVDLPLPLGRTRVPFTPSL